MIYYWVHVSLPIDYWPNISQESFEQYLEGVHKDYNVNPKTAGDDVLIKLFKNEADAIAVANDGIDIDSAEFYPVIKVACDLEGVPTSFKLKDGTEIVDDVIEIPANKVKLLCASLAHIDSTMSFLVFDSVEEEQPVVQIEKPSSNASETRNDLEKDKLQEPSPEASILSSNKLAEEEKKEGSFNESLRLQLVEIRQKLYNEMHLSLGKNVGSKNSSILHYLSTKKSSTTSDVTNDGVDRGQLDNRKGFGLK